MAGPFPAKGERRQRRSLHYTLGQPDACNLQEGTNHGYQARNQQPATR